MNAKKKHREGKVIRSTKETNIEARVVLDGSGKGCIQTGIGFFDHMLDHIARHSLMDLEISASGDLHIDPHHTVEDVGICFGKALVEAIGDCAGLARYGHAVIPMDEALAETIIDISGRPFLAFKAELPFGKTGTFDAELAEEFFRAVAVNARMTLHIRLHYGKNLHHCLEAIYKAFGRALRAAITLDPKVSGAPSTKGILDL